MNGKIPDDAFERYVALGADRSYQRLADVLGVSKRAVSKCATKGKWGERLVRIEEEARVVSDKKLAETLEEQRDRHLKTLRAMHARALTGLKQYPLKSGWEAIKAAELCIKLERLIAGEATERPEVTVERVTRRELDQFLVTSDEVIDAEGAGEAADDEW